VLAPLALLAGVAALAALALSREDAPLPPTQATPPPGPPPGPPAGLSERERSLFAGLHPDAQSWLALVLADVRAAGLSPRLVSGRRTCAEQRALFAKGRTAPGPIVTKADGCRSWHAHGRAVDVQLSAAADYQQLGEAAKRHGGKWGGDFQGFPDPGHIEYHPGLTIEQACPNPDDCEQIVKS